jgi:YVTN family beta-propeller protein
LGFALVLTTNGPDVCLPTVPPTAPPPAPPNTLCDPSAHPSGISRIDVSGDSNVGTATVGLGPVHAALLPPNGSQAFIANKLEDTISSYATSNAATVTTISLPAGSAPAYVHTTQTDTVYIANSGNTMLGNGTVSVISSSRNVVTKTIEVGKTPIALAETPDGKKLYVVNQGDNSVSVVTTVDENVAVTLPIGSNPTWAAARNDNRFVYVLNSGDGTISVIDTISDQVLASPVPVPNANFAFYDKNLNHIYLTTSDRKVLTLDVSSDSPAVLPTLDLGSVVGTPCPSTCVLDSVTTLPASTPNGSRVYVASHSVNPTACTDSSDTPPCITTNIFVLKAPSNSLQTTITTLHKIFVNGAVTSTRPDVPVVPYCDTLQVRRYVASSGDSSKVYVANCDAGGTDIIRTSDNTFVLNLPAPVSSLPPMFGQTFPPPQRPTFVLPGR